MARRALALTLLVAIVFALLAAALVPAWQIALRELSRAAEAALGPPAQIASIEVGLAQVVITDRRLRR